MACLLAVSSESATPPHPPSMFLLWFCYSCPFIHALVRAGAWPLLFSPLGLTGHPLVTVARRIALPGGTVLILGLE